MSNSFFSRFPKIEYNLGNAEFITLTNIVKNVDADDFFANNSAYYTYYEIQDGERPDTVSYKLYENPNYHWTFFVLNNDLRSGLNLKWPLSTNQLEKMLANEYDAYSTITVKPHNETNNNGTQLSGLAHLMNFSEANREFLRLVNDREDEEASVLTYDNALLQLVICDIKRVSDGKPVSSINNFINSQFFKLKWKNPFVENTDEWQECQHLKTDLVNAALSEYTQFDPNASISDFSIFEGLLTQAEITQATDERNAQYVFNKRYTPTDFKWVSHRNAASEFYIVNADDGLSRSVSAYDAVNGATTLYISNEEKETLFNERKEKIRVVRKERMADFVNSYFKTLNS